MHLFRQLLQVMLKLQTIRQRYRLLNSTVQAIWVRETITYLNREKKVEEYNL